LHKPLFKVLENSIAGACYVLKNRAPSETTNKLKKQTLDNLLAASSLCFPRVYITAARQYQKVARGIEPTFENLLGWALADFRALVVDGLVPSGEQSLHDAGKLIKAFGKNYDIPASFEIADYEDPFKESGEGVDLAKAERQFLN